MIPKNLHMIWVGNVYTRPDEWINTWRDKNPTWNFRLWNDNDLENGDWLLGRHIRRLYHKRRFDGVCDLMRYEILARHGGVYADADSICLRPLDIPLRAPSFWAVFESEKSRPGKIQNAFMGAMAGNRVLLNMIAELSARHNALKRWSWRHLRQVTLPTFEATGPDFLTRSIKRSNDAGVTIFPSHYFFPRDVAGNVYKGQDEPYADHFYGTAHGAYQKIRWSREG